MDHRRCETGTISGEIGLPYSKKDAQADAIALLLREHPGLTKFEFTEWRRSTQITRYVCYVYTLYYS